MIVLHSALCAAIGAGEAKRTAEIAATLVEGDVEHCRLDGRQGVRLGILLADVASDGPYLFACLVAWTAEDRGVSGEANAGAAARATEAVRDGLGTARGANVGAGKEAQRRRGADEGWREGCQSQEAEAKGRRRSCHGKVVKAEVSSQ